MKKIHRKTYAKPADRQKALHALRARSPLAPTSYVVPGLGFPPEYLDADAKRFFLAHGSKVVAVWKNCIDLKEADRIHDKIVFGYLCLTLSELEWYTTQVCALKQKSKHTAAEARRLKCYGKLRVQSFSIVRGFAELLCLGPEIFMTQ